MQDAERPLVPPARMLPFGHKAPPGRPGCPPPPLRHLKGTTGAGESRTRDENVYMQGRVQGVAPASVLEDLRVDRGPRRHRVPMPRRHLAPEDEDKPGEVLPWSLLAQEAALSPGWGVIVPGPVDNVMAVKVRPVPTAT